MTDVVAFLGVVWVPEREPLRASTCPHCSSEIREYRYQLHTHHALFLEALVRANRPMIKRSMPGLSKSTYNTGTQIWRWGLVHSASPTNRGPWSVTDMGRAFMAGNLLVPQYVVVRMLAGAKSLLVRFEGAPTSYLATRTTIVDESIYDEKVEEQREARQNPEPTPPPPKPPTNPWDALP